MISMSGVSWEVRCLVIGFVLCLATGLQCMYQYAAMNSMQLLLMGFVNQSAQAHFNVSITMSAMVWVWPTMVSVPILIGLLFATWVAPRIADTRGRRIVIMIISPVLMLMAAISMFIAKPANSVLLLFLGFILARLAFSIGDPIACSYLTEISPQRLRGTISTLSLALRPIGSTMGAMVGSEWFFGTQDNWNLVYAVMGAMSICMVFYPWVPESPKHLLINIGDSEGALKALKQLNVPLLEQEELMERYQVERDRDQANVHSKAALTELLFTRRHIRLNLVNMIVSLSFPMCCAVLMTTYSTVYFLEVGLPLQEAQMFTIIRNVTTLIFGMFGTYITDKMPRRIFLIVGMLLNALFLMLGCFFGSFHKPWSAWVSSISIIIANCFACSPRNMSQFYANELVTTRFRTAAGMFSFAVCYFGFMPEMWLFNFFLYIMGSWCLMPWAITSVLSCVILFFIMPETRNRRPEDVYAELIGQPDLLLEDEEALLLKNDQLNLMSGQPADPTATHYGAAAERISLGNKRANDKDSVKKIF